MPQNRLSRWEQLAKSFSKRCLPLCFFSGLPWVRGKWAGVMSGLRRTVHLSCCCNSRWVKGSEAGLRMCLTYPCTLTCELKKESSSPATFCSMLLSLAADTENPQGPGIYFAVLYWHLSHELQIPPVFQVELGLDGSFSSQPILVSLFAWNPSDQSFSSRRIPETQCQVS